MSSNMPEPAALPISAAGFKIELADFTLLIADTTKPMWHGQYKGGVLSIYVANVEPATDDGLDDSKLPGGDTYVVIYSLPDRDDFFSYASFESSVSQESVADKIIQMVDDVYIKHLPTESREVVRHPHNRTLH